MSEQTKIYRRIKKPYVLNHIRQYVRQKSREEIFIIAKEGKIFKRPYCKDFKIFFLKGCFKNSNIYFDGGYYV